ncbi:MAG: MFS transporter [Coriobacteriales bacterium]|jgi:predicted MFS family arabinose efflux permease|nr:MFS transporter [Coriobacteriales bacterium]
MAENIDKHIAAGKRMLEPDAGLPVYLLWIFAILAGISVANIYYIQPLLNMVKSELVLNDFQASLISLANQGGYAIGLFLIIPLGDLLQRKRVILVNIVILMVALVSVALSHNVVIIIIASLAAGACSVTPQLLIPIASQFSKPADKGKNMGIVLTGLLVGIIGARVISGTFGQFLGWRSIYFIAAALMLASGVTVLAAVPRIASNDFRGGYIALMRSVLSLPRKYPRLMLYATRYALCFASLLAMWTTLTFKMGLPPFNAPAGIIGLLGICGIAGALTASFIGKYTERLGSRRFNLIGCGAGLLAWICFFVGQDSYVGIIAGIIIIDVGMQFISLGNQTSVFALEPKSSNRLNTVYMTTGFVGGALGTFLSGAAWHLFAWPGVCATGAVLVLCSLAITLAARRF